MSSDDRWKMSETFPLISNITLASTYKIHEQPSSQSFVKEGRRIDFQLNENIAKPLRLSSIFK